MVGLDEFKKQVHDLTAAARLEEAELICRGEQATRPPMNFTFTGPPGTGKILAARALTRELHALGLIERDHVVEANRYNCIGAFEGETAQKTAALLQKSRGGVLYLDDAYDLVRHHLGFPDPFGKEALDTVLAWSWRTTPASWW